MPPPSIPLLSLADASSPHLRPTLLRNLRSALFDVGFLYIADHGVPPSTIAALISKLPALFGLANETKARLSKIHSPHFLGYSGFAEETTLGQRDLREQWDFGSEVPAVWQGGSGGGKSKNRRGSGEVDLLNGDGNESENVHEARKERDFSQMYWRLRGPNQWPDEEELPGFRAALTEYHDAVQALSYRFVHLVEEAFGIPVGTFDDFFLPRPSSPRSPVHSSHGTASPGHQQREHLQPQHRIKLIKYPPSNGEARGQGVGAHKDSSGWLTFLYQVGKEEGLEVLSNDGEWIPAPPLDGTFVVNFGNAFEAATEGAVRATVHRVKAPTSTSQPRYSIPFFQGLPLDMTVSEIRTYIPESVRKLRKEHGETDGVASFLDPRWDSLGESQLRKWIRSHEDVGRKWYGDDVVEYYKQ